jgi:hypothetical protein
MKYLSFTGTSEKIVKFLRQYPVPISIGFLKQQIGCDEIDGDVIDRNIKDLEKEGIIATEGKFIVLCSEAEK